MTSTGTRLKRRLRILQLQFRHGVLQRVALQRLQRLSEAARTYVPSAGGAGQTPIGTAPALATHDPDAASASVVFFETNCRRIADILALQAKAGVVGGFAEIGIGAASLRSAARLPDDPAQVYLSVHLPARAAGLPLIATASAPAGAGVHRIDVGGAPLQVAALQSPLAARRLRLVSIAASDSATDIAHHLDVAARLLAAGGVVLVHRIPDADWPGVMEGVSRYFLLEPVRRLFPFMMADKLLWLTTYDHHARLLHYARHAAPTGPMQHKRVTNFFGTEMVGF